MQKITGVQCPQCRAVIFSRAHYDYHNCPCGNTAVDGGRDYMRIGFKDVLPMHVQIELGQGLSIPLLEYDYNKRINKLGTIPRKSKCRPDWLYRLDTNNRLRKVGLA